MSRHELVAAIQLLSRSASLEELGRLTLRDLQQTFIKLKVKRFQVINERRRQLPPMHATNAHDGHNLRD